MDLQTRTAPLPADPYEPLPLHVGFVVPPGSLSIEDEAALGWLRQAFDTVTLAPLGTGMTETGISSVDVLWIHIPDEAAWERWALSPADRTGLRTYVEQGGRLLLTNYAAFLPHEIGIEPRRPEARTTHIEDKGFGRGYGFQSFRGHPVLDAFFGGVYVWYPEEDLDEGRVGYFDDVWPEAGRIVGIEKSYITLHQDNKLLIEHMPGQGRVLSAGAFLHFAEPNHRAEHARRFVRDALQYLAAPAAEKATYWVRDDSKPKPFAISSHRLRDVRAYETLPDRLTDLCLSRDEATDNFVDVTGRRCMVMGKECGGIDEVWIHPFRILHDLEVDVIIDGRVHRLADLPNGIDILPESVVRTYKLPNGTLRETMWAALHAPGGLLAFDVTGTGPVQLVVRFRSDFRWMWPYRENSLGSLHYGYDAALNALHIHDPSGDFRAVIGGDRTPLAQLGGAFEQIDYLDGAFHGTPSDRNQITQAFLYELDGTGQDRLHVAFAGTSAGGDEAERTYRSLLSDPRACYEEAARHCADLLATRTMLTTPDEEFNTGYRWALLATDRFWATTPGLGTGLLAGYGTTARGWHGGHDVSGRPGYAWYFGRDAQWASFAVDGYGDFASVKQQLDLFRRLQDVTGKIFHELPSSGLVHYDAADSTPLYVSLIAHYLRASGDVEGARDLWPSLLEAMAFLYSTDTDGDGYIENTYVGHGWIEGGKLYGAHTTLYLAGTWAQALRDAAYVARTLGEEAETERFAADAEDVVDRIEHDFWNGPVEFYHYGKLRDGSFNPEQTILPAVLLYFRLLSPERVGRMLESFASNDFTTDWGVRILSARSELFNPRGYHYGSVWPLFTGWTALAEYAYGNSTQAFTHVMNNLLVYRHWSLGFVEEVLNGVQYEPAGVCAHQCWSETNVLHPLYEGMLGFHPDAPNQAARLEPRIPAAWDTFRADNLWAGPSRIRLELERENTRTTYRLTLQEGPPVSITFAPEIPSGTHVSTILVNGAPSGAHIRGATGLLDEPLDFTLSGTVTVRLVHEGGIEVLPVVPRPEPGDASREVRILHARLEDSVYAVLLEGCSGSTHEVRVRLFDQAVGHVEGAKASGEPADGLLTLHVRFDEAPEPHVRKTVRLHLA